MRAIHFGAGNIGRGFIGKILADAGWSVTFADIDATLVAELAQRGSYKVDVVGKNAITEDVTGVDAVLSTSDDLITLIAQTDLVTTAVGPAILPRIAPTVAKGLQARMEAGNDAALNVIACENTIRGTTQLKKAVFEHLSEDLKSWVEQHVGFADSAVDRIVPPAPEGTTDPLAVTVEEFSEWIVDETQLLNFEHEVPGMELTDNLMAFVERKLFTLNTGHAITAYLGTKAGHATIRDAILDETIAATVRSAMQESGEVLKMRYGFDADKHAAYIQKILGRFANPYLKDDVKRVGREPLRKLGKSDRLIRPLLGTLEYDLPNSNLIKGILAALAYDNSEDPQTIKMRQMIDDLGIQDALNQFTENALPASLCKAIATAYKQS